MPQPVLQAMVLADHVYQDRMSGKYIIAGTFGRIGLRMPAAQTPPAPPTPLPAAQLQQPPAFAMPGQPAPAAAASAASAPAAGQPASASTPAHPPTGGAHASPPAAQPPAQERTTHSLESATAQISVSGSPFLYLALTGIHGKASLTIRFVNLADATSLFDAILDVTAADPVALSEYCVPMPPLPCSKPGTYSLDLLYANELLGSWRIMAVAS